MKTPRIFLTINTLVLQSHKQYLNFTAKEGINNVPAHFLQEKKNQNNLLISIYLELCQEIYLLQICGHIFQGKLCYIAAAFTFRSSLYRLFTQQLCTFSVWKLMRKAGFTHTHTEEQTFNIQLPDT